MLLNCFLSLTVILLGAFGLHCVFGIKSQFTPIISLTLLVNISVIFAMYNRLKLGVVVSYGIAVALFAIGVYRNRKRLKQKVSGFFTPGVILFIIACFAMLLFMASKQPMMTEWDEFSFWGISGKLVKIHDQIYTYYKSSMIGNSTPPALPVLSYYFQWFNREFTEWISFFGYDVMFFACYSAFTAMFDRKNWNSAVMVYLFGFLLPYVFEVYTKIIHVEPVYMITYADIPLGVVFRTALAVYIFSEKNDSSSVLSLLTVIVFLTFIKDMGFALSCIVAFIAFFDMVAGRENYSFLKIKGFFGKTAAGFVMVSTALATFLSWSMHMARVMQRDPFALGGETNMGMVQMLFTGVKELLFGPKSEKFVTIQGLMTDAFFNIKISFLGSGFMVVIVITTVFMLSVLLNDKKGRNRRIVMWITSFIGFVGYYVFHIFLYVYIFKDNAYSLVSYNRYIYPYYMGWLALAVFSLCMAVKNGKRFFAKTAMFCFCGIILVLFKFYTSPEYLFIGCSDRTFALRNNIAAKVSYIKDRVGKEDVIYLYSGGDNGERWFIYTHELAANYIMEDHHVDTSACKTEQEIRDLYRNTFLQRFKQAGVTHVMIDASSDFFTDTFGDLFDEDISYIGLDSMAYYKVNYENDFFNFTKVKGGLVE